MRNPVKYPDPDSFRPERFLSPGYPTYLTPLTTYPSIKNMSSFGFGQRACLGQSLTQDEMLLACSAVVWAFDLRKKVDKVSGKEVEIDTLKSNSLLIVKPDPFQMAFLPRSAERGRLVRELWGEAERKDVAEREAFLQNARESREKGVKGVSK